MRRIFIIFSLSYCISLMGQSSNIYEVQSGEKYWKNRKPFEGYWQQDVHYKISASINDVEESIEGIEKLTYYNNSPDTLNEIYFHLYQNAFTPNSYAHNLRKSGKIKTTFGEHELKGVGTDIAELLVNGTSIKYTIDNTILKISLNQPLLPNHSLDFEIWFETFWDKQDGGNMRRRMKTFKHHNVTHFDGVHWYPRICVYDRKFGWTTDQHLGKEFYGDFGIFEVELQFPNQYVVEATGELENREEALPKELRQKLDIKNFRSRTQTEISKPIIANGTTKTWKYKAINVHDFAFTADPTYRIGEAEWEGIKCIALVQEQNAHGWQKTADYVSKVVKTYSEEIGMYGYPKIVAADARDGMEYPMLTLNSGNWPGHRYVIAHEVGHNWFFGMIGNNETYRASLDEGFTQFLTALSLKKIGNLDYYQNPIDKGVVFNRYLNHAVNDNNATLNTHSDHFNSAERHGGGYGQVYFKTASMLYNLQYVLGDELFSAALKNYFNQWQYAHPYWEDFKTSIIQYTKVDLNWFFDQWLESNKTIDYRIKSIRQAKDSSGKISLIRKSTMQMPLDVDVVFADDSVEHHYIPNTYFVKLSKAKKHKTWIGWDQLNPIYTFNTTSNKKIKDVIIDPSGRMADVNRLNNKKKNRLNFNFSKYQRVNEDYDAYNLRWHPNIWYNGNDGLKFGIDLYGVYFGNKHKVNSSFWYNSQLFARENGNSSNPFSYKLDYETRIGEKMDLILSSRHLDGVILNKVGVTKNINSSSLEIFAKSINRSTRSDVNYLIYRDLWSPAEWNNTLNLKWNKKIKHFNGQSNILVSTRGSYLWSSYNYARINAEYKRTLSVNKFRVRTRAFVQYGVGNYAPESKLMLAGGNNEEMMDNALVRSIGIVPKEFEGYGNTFNHLHYKGGLNLRGYSGYTAINENDTRSYAIHSGTSGFAGNLEIDFSRYILPKTSFRGLKLNSYLFGDAGWLQNSTLGSGLRADAGIGGSITFMFNQRNYIKPITIRTDFPLFVNRIPAAEDKYLDFRYLIGISKAL